MDYAAYKGYSKIIIPERYAHGPEDRAVWGRVVALGPLTTVRGLSVGDHVVFGKWAGARLLFQEAVYILVRDYEILAIDTNHERRPARRVR